MKHNYLAWRHLDAATETKGGGAIIEAIEKNHKAVSEQIEAVKTAHQKALDDAKSELQEEISKAKATAQKAQEQVEEANKTLASVKSMGEANQKVKSLQDVIAAEIDAKADQIEKFARKEIKSVAIELKGFDVKAVADVSTGNVTGGSVYGAQYRPGIIQNPSRLRHIRSLLNVVPAGPGTDSYFMRENGAGEGAPAPTSEKKAAAASNAASGLLPSFDIDLVEASVKFETIGGVMPISRKAMRNIPAFMSFLQNRVPEKLLNVEDAQLLYGDGSSPNLKGIFTSGNFVAGQAAGTTALAEKILADLSTFADTYERQATGIAMRPADFYSFFKQKASGSGEYNLPEGFVFVDGVLYILGIPVATTTALTANDYVLGDWDNGTELQVQDSITMEFFEQDGTNIRTLQTTLRVLETVALPIFGSDYFMKGSSALA